MADGTIRGDDLVCGLHGWDYRIATGISAYDDSQRLHQFTARVDEGALWVDGDEIEAYGREHPQPFDRSAYQGAYADPRGTPDEPRVATIARLADGGLAAIGSHGPMVAMGVPRAQLPAWDDIQFTTAQLARRPLLDDHPVTTAVTIGPAARRPLHLDIPLFVSDMSFGALSEEAKVALATGAERAGTGICSGEGGMLPDEQQANQRYLCELGSGRFGWDIDHVRRVQAFHLKLGQGAKTGTGGHLPGIKVRGRIAEVRGLPEGTAAVSPSTFTRELSTADGMRDLIGEVRAASDGIPIGVKLSAQRIEADLNPPPKTTDDRRTPWPSVSASTSTPSARGATKPPGGPAAWRSWASSSSTGGSSPSSCRTGATSPKTWPGPTPAPSWRCAPPSRCATTQARPA